MIYDKFTCSTQDPGLRRDYIGASDAPIIMGDSPWCTPLRLYEIKLGLSEPITCTDAMQRGIDLEPEALAELKRLTGADLRPFRMFSARTPYMMANFDAMDDLRTIAAEIKCPLQPDFSEKVPKKYFAQIQHQLYVSRLKEMMYFCYHPLGSKLIWVKEDLDYQKELVEKEKDFYDRLKDLSPPEATDRDYQTREDELWQEISEEYKYLYTCSVEINAQLKECRDKLIEQADGKSTQGNGVKVCRSIRKGAIDYSKAFEITDIDLDQFRKESTTSWRIFL